MNTLPAVRRLWLAWLVAGVAVAASLVVVTKTHHHGTKVLGEKIVGSGTSSGGTSVGGNAKANGNSANAGGGNKTFSIAGDTDGLYPGGTVNLQLTVSNPQNQAMTVRSLSAQLQSIVPAGTTACTTTVTIGAWTGSPFTLDASAKNVTVPGSIPVTIAHSTPDSCQGATFNFTYSGSATQK